MEIIHCHGSAAATKPTCIQCIALAVGDFVGILAQTSPKLEIGSHYLEGRKRNEIKQKVGLPSKQKDRWTKMVILT